MNSTNMFLALLAGVSLAACGEALPDSGPINQPAESSDTLDLSGHYRIERLGDGKPLPFALEVSADANAIWWEPACAGQGLAYRSAEGRAEFYDPQAGQGPQIVCDIGLPEELPRLWDEIEGVRGVSIGDDRTLILSDGERQWVFEPTTDPLPDDLSGRWRLEELNGRASVEMLANQFVADGSRLWWEPLCADQVVTYEMDGKRFRVTEPAYTPPDPPAPGAQPTAVPREVCAIGVPDEVGEALNAMRLASKVARDNRNNIVISGSEQYVVLKRIGP